jgi:hypothetical protein
MTKDPELQKWIDDTIKDLSAVENVADASAILFSAAITMLYCSGYKIPDIAQCLEKALANFDKVATKRTGVVR